MAVALRSGDMHGTFHAGTLPVWKGPDPVGVAGRAAVEFAPISLEEMGAAALMDRVDRKFLLPAQRLPEILEPLTGRYRALEVGGHRLSRYSTRYFDTPELALYHAHHSGRARRYKVRVRRYLDSESRWLEVKLKATRGRTLKKRVSLAHDRLAPMERLAAEAILGVTDAVPAESLREAAVVEYSRLTLVCGDAPERITLDLMLTFSRGGSTRSFPGVVVAELKQPRRAASPFLEIVREMGVREGAPSKYCAAIATLEPRAKSNRFREAVRRLENIDRGAGAAILLDS